MLPKDPNTDIRESTFFQHWDHLPTPADVRAHTRLQFLSDINPDPRKCFRLEGPNWYPPPAVFVSMNLFVKLGGEIEIAEGQCLFALRHTLQSAVPVPEVYGWRTGEDFVFIYMELLKGQTSEQVWNELDTENRILVCHELRVIFDSIRQLEQDSENVFTGKNHFSTFQRPILVLIN